MNDTVFFLGITFILWVEVDKSVAYIKSVGKRQK